MLKYLAIQCPSVKLMQKNLFNEVFVYCSVGTGPDALLCGVLFLTCQKHHRKVERCHMLKS